ncbi:SAF domain-containing protein [Nocardioides flavescens]|uniref:Pilus assembly protein CpaB n=1 Tax=Nocardioides flavescens TaxID=2691959 RepID=A0A6L7EVW0_9ACTN|nr:SAF domain-containing protein [Nocardioides flavescens]MXG91617.1 pilus assembly protein CpaB [Nocardioides flavescens]
MRLPSRLTRPARAVRRSVLRRRRPLAAVCALVAVVSGVQAAAPAPPATVAVTVAARDLAAGAVVAAGDVTTARLPPDAVPDGRVRDPVGRTLAGAVRRGTPVTDTALVGAALVAEQPGTVALPVRLPDSAMVALLHLGDRVDLVAADPQGGPASTVVRDALVLAIPPPTAGAAADGLPGRLVVLGVPETQVDAVSSASLTHFLTVAWSR